MAVDNIENISRLGPLQHGVLFDALRMGGASTYQMVLELTGEVRPAFLRQAWQATLRRHPGLRVSFHHEGLDHPVQVVRYDADPAWAEYNWRDRVVTEHDIAAFAAADRATPFDLTVAPLLRLSWVDGGASRSWLVWTFHSVLLDGWSTHLVLDDVLRHYRTLVAGPAEHRPAPRPSWEYVAWLGRHSTEAGHAYWQDQLADLAVPGLLIDDGRPDGDPGHDEMIVDVSTSMADALRSAGRAYRVSLGTLIHAAWAVALGRISDRNDVVLGGVVSGRDPSFDGVEELVGLFINNLPVRVALEPSARIGDWLTDLQGRMTDARAFSHLPLAVARQASGLPADTSLFDSMVAFANYPAQKQWTQAGDFEVTGITMVEDPPYPLAIVGHAEEAGVFLSLRYDRRRISGLTSARLAAFVSDVLAALTAGPDRLVGELPAWPYEPVYGRPGARDRTATDSPGSISPELLEATAMAWRAALDIPDEFRLTGQTNFFDVGGYSLLAIKLISRIRTDFGINLPIAEFFSDPTVGGTARLIQSLLGGDAGQGHEPIPRRPREEPPQASFAQERLWLVDQVNAKSGAANLMSTARFRHAVDETALRNALRRLVQRHEVLRTNFEASDGHVVQLIRPSGEPSMTVHDLSAVPSHEGEATARQILASAAAERFDLRRDVPFRLSMVRLAPDDVVVGICLHHIVYDGWSAHVLFGDLAALYESERTGLTDRLPELPVQYADFSIWQRERLTGPDAERIAGYWRDQLAGVPEQLRLAPAPHTREGATDPGGMVIRDLPAETVASIRRLSTREAATPYMIVLAALGTLVAARAGRDDIVIGSPVTDRDHPDLDHLIGLFVNTQVLRLRIEQGAEFRATLASVRKVCLDALAHRGMPFGDIVRMVAPKRAADASPLVQISYAFQNPTDRRLVLDGRSAEDFPVLPTVGRFELTVEVYDWTTGMGCALQYDPAIYRREFIEAFADDFVTLLGETTGDPDRAVRIRSRGEEADRLRDRSRDRLLALKGLSPH